MFYKNTIERSRALNKVHLQILIPRKDSDADQKQENTHDFKQYI